MVLSSAYLSGLSVSRIVQRLWMHFHEICMPTRLRDMGVVTRNNRLDFGEMQPA